MSGGPHVRTDDLAVTNQRVTTLERGIRDLQDDQSRMGKDLTAQINNVATGLSTKLEGIVGQINERSKIQWPALSLLLGVLVSLGGLVYWPIKDNQQRFEQHLLAFAEKAVTQKEFDQRWSTGAQRRDDWQRAAEDRMQNNSTNIEKLRESVVPRWMHDEKWRVLDNKLGEFNLDITGIKNSVVDRRELDERFKSLLERSQDLQRQIDKQDKMFGDTYSLRDIVNRILRKQDELEAEVRQKASAQR